MPFFLYATLSRDRVLLESSVGPCPFCNTPDASMDIVEQRSRTSFFGLWPHDSTDRLACCQTCGRSIKEVHYNLRTKPPVTFQPSGAISVEENKENMTIVKPIYPVIQENDVLPVMENMSTTTPATRTTNAPVPTTDGEASAAAAAAVSAESSKDTPAEETTMTSTPTTTPIVTIPKEELNPPQVPLTLPPPQPLS